MRTARFFVPPEWIAEHAKAFSLPAGPLHKQIVQVLRMQPGDLLSLLPNNGSEFTGRITDLGRHAITGILEEKRSIAPPSPHILLCASITKRDTFEWMLQKCTELGVQEFIPLHTARTIKKTPERKMRWEDIVKEACEQSGQATLPVLHNPMTLGEAFTHTRNGARILLHEEGEERKLPTLQKTMPLALFIGPEGGFAPEEITKAIAEKIHIVRLGQTVLRAETAAVATCAKLLW